MRRFGPPAVAAAALLGFILACGRAAALRPLPQEERLAAVSDEEALTLSLSHATPSWVLSKEQHATEQPPTTAGYEHSAMPELVIRKGYPLEEHFVTTADGYVLGVYRISHGRAGPSDGRRPAVLLQHGLLDSSAAWVLNDPDQSLGFLLADAGWDVWMSNSRGNAFSRNHTGIDPSMAAFWLFTWDDMAAYDIPAAVGYVLRLTGHQQLAYVGHSQGTTQMFAALASNPALLQQLSLAVMLAPAVYMRHVASLPMVALASLDVDKLFNLLGPPEFLPSRKSTADLFGQICQSSPAVCVSVITAIAGFSGRNVDLTRLPDYVHYAPSGTSVMNMAHWAQAVRKSRQSAAPLFQKFDYGSQCMTARGLPRTCNQRVYGSEEPPAYDLSAIHTPLAIFSGGQDKLAGPLDVESLLETLPQGVVVHAQTLPSYEHLDFTWGVDAKDVIYPTVLDLLREHAPRAPAL